ncbi:MAG TPA: hypothetical protein VFS02_04015 [Telluria sp.]|nr:hypothetical protein [Telluria sp.]
MVARGRLRGQARCAAGAGALATPGDACILTDDISTDRLEEDEVPAGFSSHVPPWEYPEWRERFVLEAAAGAPVMSGRPAGAEQALTPAAHHQRLVLSLAEQQRYRQLGSEAAAAMTEVMRTARRDWAEHALAGEGARCGRGIGSSAAAPGLMRRRRAAKAARKRARQRACATTQHASAEDRCQRLPVECICTCPAAVPRQATQERTRAAGCARRAGMPRSGARQAADSLVGARRPRRPAAHALQRRAQTAGRQASA